MYFYFYSISKPYYLSHESQNRYEGDFTIIFRDITFEKLFQKETLMSWLSDIKFGMETIFIRMKENDSYFAISLLPIKENTLLYKVPTSMIDKPSEDGTLIDWINVCQSFINSISQDYLPKS